MKKYTVLVVDDEKEIVDAIERYLRRDSINVLKAYDGREALAVVEQHEVHLILMDVMMPKLDGIEATMAIREQRNIPIIILTARVDAGDKIWALDCGADDYITKPFHPPELVARVKAQLRRYIKLGQYQGGVSKDSVIRGGRVQLNRESKQAYVDDQCKALTPLEYKILELLMLNTGRVFPAEEIYERIWQQPCISTDTVMVHIRKLREKIEENPKKPKNLKVVWGIGYKFEGTE